MKTGITLAAADGTHNERRKLEENRVSVQTNRFT
jgi:hypothetical protein